MTIIYITESQVLMFCAGAEQILSKLKPKPNRIFKNTLLLASSKKFNLPGEQVTFRPSEIKAEMRSAKN